MQFYNGKSSYSTDTYTLKSKNENYIDTYFLYILLKQLENFINCFLFKGSGLKHLQKTELKSLKILLPPLEIQEKIVQSIELVEQQIDFLNLKLEFL